MTREGLWGHYAKPDHRHREDAEWFEYEVNDDWAAAALLVGSEGSVLIAEVCVFPRNDVHGTQQVSSLGNAVPAGGLTASKFREVVLGPALDECKRREEEARAAGGVREALALWRKRLDLKQLTPEQLEQAYSRKELLALLAARYVELIPEAEAPNQILAGEFGLPVTKIRDRLHAARRAGLLTKPRRRGVAGGHLTKEGQAIVLGLQGLREELRGAERRAAKASGRRSGGPENE